MNQAIKSVSSASEESGVCLAGALGSCAGGPSSEEAVERVVSRWRTGVRKPSMGTANHAELVLLEPEDGESTATFETATFETATFETATFEPDGSDVLGFAPREVDHGERESSTAEQSDVPDPSLHLVGEVDSDEPGSEMSPSLRASILVVDDDPKNLAAMEVALSGLEVEQHQARSGEEALRHLLKKDFALILLDVQMPKMDGFETARIIRSRKKNRHVPIMFVTAFSHDDADMRRGYELGAVDYLFKPIVPDVLRAKVQALVELRKRTLQVEEQARRLRAMERAESEHRLNEERRRWEADSLRLQNQHLAESDRKKDEFIAVLAHELRNPLAPLVNALEGMAVIGLPNAELQRSHDIMERQVHHLTRLVDDLLDVSRISRGKLDLRCEELSLREIIEHAAEACHVQLEERRQRFFVEGPEHDISLVGDRVRLVQMVVNLLTNASRYTKPEGSVTLIWGAREPGQAFIQVRDTGKGIAPEAQDRIFEMFVQERDGGRGLGLGLTLVRQIVQMHGGTVTVKSEGRGQGSEFEVRMPTDRVSHISSVDPYELPSSVVEKQVAAESSPSTQRSREIVLVEDDDDVRETLGFLLEQWGHVVHTAASGTEGVDLIQRVRPEIALLDIGLPGLDGYGVAAKVCETMGEERPALIALSGYGQARDRERSRAAGFDAHLVKPAEPNRLRALLTELN